ncbi:MAG: hypothetical protein FYV88_0220 [Bacteroidetes bacterium]|nr:hypothetical protein [Bacteroidota bacterium]
MLPMRKYLFIIGLIVSVVFSNHLFAQQTEKNESVRVSADSVVVSSSKSDTIPYHDPKIATRRSALIPGWGQAYNRQYWKIPIAYGIIAIPVVMYVYNNDYYKKMKFAYEARYKQEVLNDNSDVPKIDPELVNLPIESLLNYRNVYSRDRDYSVLFFLLAWGFQVADATVFAHLKQFDVSNNLSMQVKPQIDPFLKNAGLSITLQLKSPTSKRAEAR